MPASPLWDPNLIRAFQSLGAWLEGPMQFFTTLGREPFYLALLPLVFWCVNKRMGRDLVVLLILSNFTNGLSKELFKTPRPFWIDPGIALSSEESFGLPSGHALNAALLWGYLAARPWQKMRTVRGRQIWRWSLVALIVMISISRIYLGVHYLGDVLGGWALGLLALGVYLRLHEPVGRWLGNRSFPIHVALAVATAAFLLGACLAAISLPSSDRALYGPLFLDAQNATRETASSLAGMVLGLWLGLLGEARQVRFSTSGTLRQRALRYLIGMAGLTGLWGGLKAIFPTELHLLGMGLRIVRYAAMAFWVAWAWPWLFVRLRLATNHRSPGPISTPSDR